MSVRFISGSQKYTGDAERSLAPVDTSGSAPSEGSATVPSANNQIAPELGGDGAPPPLTTASALSGGLHGPEHMRPLVETSLRALSEGAARRSGPLPAAEPHELAEQVRDVLDEVLPATGSGAAAALEPLTRMLASGAADPADPSCAAHLHCPPLAVAVAADLVASALNPSLDSWDQAPSATTLESEVMERLAELVGYGTGNTSGVMTSGGTESNLMGMMLARDAALRGAGGADPTVDGVPGPAGRLRFFCSEEAHFSVQRNAALLGLGESAVIAVPVDKEHRMDVAALERELAGCEGIPAAIVATAGTTDVGAIDPLPELAEVARRHRTWLHVDAAYGGGALFSDRLSPLLEGLGDSHSVALDLHKLGWQPVASGVFLTHHSDAMAPLARTVAYLNPADDEEAGYPSLLGYSLRTTRRADVFKVAVTLRALGRQGLGELVDTCHDLAGYAAERIAVHPRLELATDPVLTTVLFRYTASDDPDRANAELRRRLLRSGRAVIGRTEIDGTVWLKLTLLNPHTTRTDVDALLAHVVDAGTEED